MYKTYMLTTITLNTNDKSAVNTEQLYKEVNGENVPCTEGEAVLKCLNKVSSVGGNPATQAIKCILLNPNGDEIKIEEVIKPTVE